MGHTGPGKGPGKMLRSSLARLASVSSDSAVPSARAIGPPSTSRTSRARPLKGPRGKYCERDGEKGTLDDGRKKRRGTPFHFLPAERWQGRHAWHYGLQLQPDCVRIALWRLITDLTPISLKLSLAGAGLRVDGPLDLRTPSSADS
jgi:hypothetical protein